MLEIDNKQYVVEEGSGMLFFPNVGHKYYGMSNEWLVHFMCFRGSGTKDLFEKTTILAVSVSLGSADAPLDSYLNYDFQSVARPTVIHSSSMNVSWEQVFSERARTKLSFFTGQKVEERPRNYGVHADARAQCELSRCQAVSVCSR